MLLPVGTRRGFSGGRVAGLAGRGGDGAVTKNEPRWFRVEESRVEVLVLL